VGAVAPIKGEENDVVFILYRHPCFLSKKSPREILLRSKE
jgi:hypothetical protein